MADQADRDARKEMREILKRMESHDEKIASTLTSLDTIAQASAGSTATANTTLKDIHTSL